LLRHVVNVAADQTELAHSQHNKINTTDTATTAAYFSEPAKSSQNKNIQLCIVYLHAVESIDTRYSPTTETIELIYLL